MAADATEREMKAVHSENAKNNQSDGWRILQLLRSNGNPNHPFHKFSTGNLETLDTIPKAKGIDTRTELIKFHDTYYSANLMKLVILGKGAFSASLLESERWRCFGCFFEELLTDRFWLYSYCRAS
jgi:insulysin